MAPDPVRERFQQALDALVERLKTDRTVLAAVLCGSLAHDTGGGSWTSISSSSPWTISQKTSRAHSIDADG